MAMAPKGVPVSGRINVALERAELAEELQDTWNHLRPHLPPLPDVLVLDRLIPVDVTNHGDDVTERGVWQAYWAGGERARRSPNSRLTRLGGLPIDHEDF
jgi:hypothetical protein